MRLKVKNRVTQYMGAASVYAAVLEATDTMPRDGSMILSDVRGSTLAIACEACGRRGRYNVERLMAEHGDAKLTDLLQTVVDCPKARSVSVHDRCKALYQGLTAH